ncbi:MAG: class II glutamine amidotransferase [Candidatus Sigynarchaeota archaeon]
MPGKEPIASSRSELANLIAKGNIINSRLMISHDRAGNVGPPCYENTHPFYKALNEDKELMPPRIPLSSR